MKIGKDHLLPSVLFGILFLGIGHDAAAKNSARYAAVRVPKSVLTLQGSPGYQTAWIDAMDQVRAIYAKNPKCFQYQPLDPQRLMVLGYEAPQDSNWRELFKQPEVSVLVGAPYIGWPTDVHPVGRIKAQVTFSPDGIEGFRATTTPEFELVCE